MNGEPVLRVHGERNSITDVPGIQVGNYTDLDVLSGLTVIIPDDRCVAGVDVRGGAPGTRETDLLNPVNHVDKIDAVLLSGGSAFGLSNADGVMRYLEEEGRGYPARDGIKVPIVPSAIIFDLYRGEKRGRMSLESGYQACMSLSVDLKQGNVGAGTGAIAGGIKGGLGTASEVLSSGVTVGAVAVVNSAGYTTDPTCGGFYARNLELGGEFGNLPELPIKGNVLSPLSARLGENTVIGVVATDTSLSKTEVTKVAQMAQDGVARAVSPAHTMFDGDTIFALSTGGKETNGNRGSLVSLIGAVAADVFSRAIIHGVINASTANGIVSYRDKFQNP
jgi:L-aminopeptidase/D-esterase-like protein